MRKRRITNANLHSSNDVINNQMGDGATPRTLQNKLTEGVSIWDFLSDAQKTDVASGTASVDTLDAFQKAINSFPATLDDNPYRQGGTVLVPFGKYYLSDTLKIDRNIILKGVGAPYSYCAGGSILVFADNKDGNPPIFSTYQK